jgi:hypothetical protein
MAVTRPNGHNGHDVTAPIFVEEATPVPVQHIAAWERVRNTSERVATLRSLLSAIVAVVLGLAIAAWYARGELEGVAKRDEVRSVTARVVEVEKASAVNESQHDLILESLRRIESKVDRIGPAASGVVVGAGR